MYTVVIVISVIFIATLFNLQIVNGENYREQSEKRMLRTKNITAPRGEIYDRNGVILATNKLSYDVELVYKEILKLYKNYIYQPIERNKLRIRKKIKGYEELINLAKYYQEKLL